MKLKNKLYSLFILLLLFSFGHEAVGQTAKVHKGFVYHQDGQPFKNALITTVIEGKSKQVTSDSLGYYEIEVLDKKMLTISYPEHYSKSLYPRAGKNSKTYLVKENRFSYERSYSNMINDDIKLRNSLGTISRVSPDEYSKVTETVDDIWSGSTPGLYSEKQSGIPGSGSFTIMRGIHSLHTSKAPIIVVDGMYLGDYAFDNPAISGNNLFTALGLNPSNVKEMVFLKDGVATLKYGLKGANGIIIINTKRSEESTTQITTDFSSGITVFDGELPMMNAVENRKYLQYQLFNSGLTDADIIRRYPSLSSLAQPGEYPRWEQNTNWQDELRKTGLRNMLNFAFSGGDEISKFYFSLGYTGNQGTLDGSKMDRLNARLNADVAVSRKLSMKVNFGFGYTEGQLFDLGPNYVTNPIYASLIKSPQLGVYEAVGNNEFQKSLDPEDVFGLSNPIGIINGAEELRKNYFLLGSFRFNYQINDKWYANLMLGNNLNQLDDDVFIPDAAIGYLPGSEDAQIVRKKDSKLINWYTNNELGYVNNWNKIHFLDFALGMNLNSNVYTSGSGSAINTGSDQFTAIQFGDVKTRRKEGAWVKDNWINAYTTLNYNYKKKYYISTGVSMNGSSRLGSEIRDKGVKVGNNIYAILPAVSVGWDISRENTFLTNVFDVFKLKAAYSIRGNDLFDNFIAKSYYEPVQYYDITGLTKGGVMNSGISWETSENIEAGIDMAFMRERFNLSVNYFQEGVNDVITKNKLAGYYGFSSMLDNSGRIEMEGFEGSLRAILVDANNFSWETELNVTTSASKIKRLSDDEIITLEGAEKINRNGETPFSFYGWNYQGVFSTDAQAEAAGLTDEFGRAFGAGDAIFEDVDNNKVIDQRDKKVIGNPFPEFWGANVNRFRWGNFGLYTKVSFSVGRDVYNYTRSKLEAGDNFFNQTTHALNAWRKQGDETMVPKWQYDDPMRNARFSTRWIEDASFVRLDDITLSYDIKLKNKSVGGLQVYLTGQNLFVLTDYLGYGPEFSYGMDASTMGIDYFSAPLNKSYIMGVKVNF